MIFDKTTGTQLDYYIYSRFKLVSNFKGLNARLHLHKLMNDYVKKIVKKENLTIPEWMFDPREDEGKTVDKGSRFKRVKK